MMIEHRIANEHSNLEPSLDGMTGHILRVRYGNLFLQNRMRKHRLYEDDRLAWATLWLG